MRQFDVEAIKLDPDMLISGTVGTYSSPPPGGLPKWSLGWYNYLQGLEGDPIEARQITKNGIRSFEISNILVDSNVEDFTISMICMPLREKEILIESNLFTIELYDFYRYIVRVGSEETVIPIDETCHYMSISRTGSKLSLSISDRRIEVSIPEGTIDALSMFLGVGSILVDKLVYSRSHNVPPEDHYAKLTPSGDFGGIEENSYIEWIFVDDIEKGRRYSGNDSEVIDGHYIIPLTGPHIAGAALRNLSEAMIEISYDGGREWFEVSDIEKIPATMESALVRSESMNFEIVLDDFETETLRLPGVAAKVNGTVYPYHRDERTYYTNATYDFSNASISITPSENEEMPNSIWLYGKISSDFIDNASITFLYCDGVLIDKSMISDRTNHLYLMGVAGDELILNPDFDTYFGVNAIGISKLDGSNPGQIKKTFDLFARNSIVSFAEEVPSVTMGTLYGQESSFRVIDVQWTI